MATTSTSAPSRPAVLNAPPLDLAAHRRLAIRWGCGIAALPILAAVVTLACVWHSRNVDGLGIGEALVSILLTAAFSIPLGLVVGLLIRVLAYNRTRGEDRAALRRVIAGVGLAAAVWLAFVAAFFAEWFMVGD